MDDIERKHLTTAILSFLAFRHAASIRDLEAEFALYCSRRDLVDHLVGMYGLVESPSGKPVHDGYSWQPSPFLWKITYAGRAALRTLSEAAHN